MRVITAHSPEYQPLADITSPTKATYAAKWGYEFHDYMHTHIQALMMWERPAFWLDALEETDDWIFWTGCDVAITNINTDCKQWLTDDMDFVVGMDINGLQSDSFFMRKSPATMAFLLRVLRMRDNNINEQMLMQMILANSYDYFLIEATVQQLMTQGLPRLEGYNKVMQFCPGVRVKMVDQRLFNAFPKEYYPISEEQSWHPGDFACHLPAKSLEDRVNFFRNLLAV